MQIGELSVYKCYLKSSDWMRSTKEANVDREERKRRIVTWGISTLRGDGKENKILKRD